MKGAEAGNQTADLAYRTQSGNHNTAGENTVDISNTDKSLSVS